MPAAAAVAVAVVVAAWAGKGKKESKKAVSRRQRHEKAATAINQGKATAASRGDKGDEDGVGRFVLLSCPILVSRHILLCGMTKPEEEDEDGCLD